VLGSPPPAPADTVKPPSPAPRPRRRSRSGGAGRGLAAGADLGVGGVDPDRFGPGLCWAARPAPARAITGKFYSAVGLSSGSVEDINFCEMLFVREPPRPGERFVELDDSEGSSQMWRPPKWLPMSYSSGIGLLDRIFTDYACAF